MSEEEMKQNLIDKYTDLLRIKINQNELDVQLAVIKAKLSSYNIDIKSIEEAVTHSKPEP